MTKVLQIVSERNNVSPGIKPIPYYTGNVIKGSHHTPMSPLLKGERTLDLFAGIFYLFRWVALPVIRTGTLTVLISVSVTNFEKRANLPFIICARLPLQTIPTYMVAGYYLAFFFSLSHNFEGVHMQSDTTRPSNKGSKERSFLYKQVCTRVT